MAKWSKLKIKGLRHLPAARSRELRLQLPGALQSKARNYQRTLMYCKFMLTSTVNILPMLSFRLSTGSCRHRKLPINY